MAKRKRVEAAPAGSLEAHKAELGGSLRARYALRLHMSAILALTILAAALTAKLLYACGIHSLLIRYPLTLTVAWLCFAGMISLWLRWFVVDRSSAASDAGDVLSAMPSNSGGSSSGGGLGSGGGSGAGGWRGGGGQYAGGGSSAEWAEASAVAHAIPAQASASSSRGSGGSSGFNFDLDLGDGFWIAIAIIILLAVAALAGGYLIFVGPEILIDAAFEALLAGGFYRSARQWREGNWMGSVFRKTWWPFALILAAALLVAAVGRSYAPEADTLPKLIKAVKGSNG